MIDLSPEKFNRIKKHYADRYGIQPVVIDEAGSIAPAYSRHPLGNPQLLAKARADALRESIRWGEVYTFFLTPGIISWMVPIVDREETRGGIMGGEVIAAEGSDDMRPTVSYLLEAGCKRNKTMTYVRSLPHWQQDKVQQAAEYLYEETYRTFDFEPLLLNRNREQAQQQRQIAESIHAFKDVKEKKSRFDGEKALFSLMRVGDKPGVRRLLNQVLADMFLRSPRVVIVQAYAIEMMGYLVRVAVENSPVLDRMLACHSQWIERLLKADTFELLCWELREILDEFMDAIYIQGYNRTNRKAREILDYIAQEYRSGLTLDDIGRAVNLSSFRVAHLIKEVTGKTVTQHIRQLRVREAQKLLLHTDTSYVEIAYALGFTDQSYFIKQFRMVTGTTPARFRHGTD